MLIRIFYRPIDRFFNGMFPGQAFPGGAATNN
jgi:hypothetical protein